MTLERNDDPRLADEEAAAADFRVGDDVEGTDEMADEDAEIAEIRADIEETRVEMGDTLQDLGNRLEPGHLVNEAKENVREATIGRVEETAKGVTDMVTETIRQNPIPAAMAAAGLALLWMNRSSGSSNGRRETMYATAYQAYRADGHQQGIADRAGQAASNVGETVGEAVGRVGETVGQVGETVGSTVGQTVQQTSWRFERLMESSPLALGAIAIGTGAVVGAILPETPPEQRVLGDVGRTVGETVREKVSEATDMAEAKVDEVERQQEQATPSPA